MLCSLDHLQHKKKQKKFVLLNLFLANDMNKPKFNTKKVFIPICETFQ